MSDNNTDADKKRKRSNNTSVSDIDSSKGSPATKKEKKKSKKSETRKAASQGEGLNETTMDEIKKELKTLNENMASVLKKDDPYLENLIKNTFESMKEDFLKSVTKRIDVLEHTLFDKEKENDRLKERVKELDIKLENAESENRQLKREVEKNETKLRGQLNDLEQHGRRNSIRMMGVVEEESESAEKTAQKVIETINTHFKDLKLSKRDIDIAHRLGKRKDGKRQIIVKFVSRYHAETILKNKVKSLKNTGIFVNEDLTKLNQQALMCVKKKLPDEIEKAWTSNGQIKNKTGNIHTVKFEDYHVWFDLPWP